MTARDSASQGFGMESKNGLANEAEKARKANQVTLTTSSVKMKFPENSPYNAGKGLTFKPN
jgi:hypothetical protein